MKISNHLSVNHFGFTLIEILVYISLFGIVFGGAITSVFEITQLNDRNYTGMMIQEEGNFLVKKIIWILSGATAISSPEIDSSSNTLSLIMKSNSIQVPVIIMVNSASSSNLEVKMGDGISSSLNNSNTEITNLFFSRSKVVTDDFVSQMVTFSFTIRARTSSGQFMYKNFSSKNYVYLP